MTKVKRGASIPLIVNDPYFSIWSPADCLTDCDTQSWTGKEQPVRGYIRVGKSTYRFMGADDIIPVIDQTGLDVSATQTTYTFENEVVFLEVTFAVDLDLQDLNKISEPVTMITVKADIKNGNEAAITFAFSEEICRDQASEELHWQAITTPSEKMVWMGKGRQTPLSSSGDLIDIDWGYLYLAAKSNLAINYQKKHGMLLANFAVCSGEEATILAAYDDVHAINYFGRATNALWKENYTGMYDLLQNYLANLAQRKASCKKIDKMIQQDAHTAGGETLDFITAFSYRQSICAHKLIRDSDGEIVFLSKECSSNGCIGTVDVSYPSIPLYLLYQTELAKGMLRPVYKFANMPVWEYDFAPHDIGRYPYATGQVYGEITHPNSKGWSDRSPHDTVYDYYQLPKGQNVYCFEQQMPIEECGNMLAMISAVYLRDKDDKFFTQYLATNLKWADYLATFGQDPENQLCTDDFAGHLAHNCNLSLKAITALGMFGTALQVAGYEEEGNLYFNQAKKMAEIWQKNAISSGEHTPLAFDKPDSWSMKYNIVWDDLFNLGLFPEKLMQKEITKYLAEANEYGIPLDQRAEYTKADWIMWISIFAQNEEEMEQIIGPVRYYLENTTNRVPFSDWYDTKDARVMNFKNRTVVGAMFMPILKQALIKNLVNV